MMLPRFLHAQRGSPRQPAHHGGGSLEPQGACQLPMVPSTVGLLPRMQREYATRLAQWRTGAHSQKLHVYGSVVTMCLCSALSTRRNLLASSPYGPSLPQKYRTWSKPVSATEWKLAY